MLKTSSPMAIRRYLLNALVIFTGAFLSSAFISHSFTPAYDSRAEDTVYTDFLGTASLSFSLAGVDADSIELSTSPNTLATSTATISVNTENETGYHLTLANNDEDTALYLDGDSTSTFSIPSVVTAVSDAAFPANGWGYQFNDNITTPTSFYSL